MNSGTSTRQRRMVSLGKVTAPKPVNLPSQKKENNQTEILLSNKPTTSWGGGNTANEGEDGQQDERHGGHMPPPRVIPAQPMPAWGGAGLPEERQKTLELASREQFPTLGSNTQDDKKQDSNGHMYNHRDESRQYGDMGQYWDQDDRRMYSESRDHHDRRHGGGNYYYNEAEDNLSPRERRMSYGYRRRPQFSHPRDYYRHDDEYLPEDYDDHARERHRYNFDDREYYPERYDNGDRYDQRSGRYEKTPHRGGYGGHERRFGPRGMNGDLYSPRRGDFGGYRDEYYGFGRIPHGRRREDVRRGDRFYEEEEEQDADQVEASTGKTPPPPPPPRRPPPPPPPGTSVSVEEDATEDVEEKPLEDNNKNQTYKLDIDKDGQNLEQEEEDKLAAGEAANLKKNPVKILKREPEAINLEIDLGTQVSRPASRTEGFAPDIVEKKEGFSVSHDTIPPSLQGLSLHPITFGEESSMATGEQLVTDAAGGFKNPEHPPGLFTSMSVGDQHDPQQTLMSFGAETEVKHNPEDISLLLNGFESSLQKINDRSQPLQFGDIVLPSTIDGCVEIDSNNQNHTSGNQHRRDSFKSRGRGRGRGRGNRGRGRGAQNSVKVNGSSVPPPPPPPTLGKTETPDKKQGGAKPTKPKKKKGKDNIPPPGLAQNSSKPTGDKKKPGHKKPQKKKQQAFSTVAPAGDKPSQAVES